VVVRRKCLNKRAKAGGHRQELKVKGQSRSLKGSSLPSLIFFCCFFVCFVFFMFEKKNMPMYRPFFCGVVIKKKK